MYAKYPSRVLHVWSVETESKYVGYQPEYVIKKPVVVPVEQNKAVNQIKVLTNEQNIRDNNNKIVGVSRKGFYNVISTKKDSQYTWYQVEKGKWIAGVTGRVIYYPAENAYATEIKEIKEKISSLEAKKADIEKQITELKNRLKEIS